MADTGALDDVSFSLRYINSQLIAHGFTASPGISLEGISNESMDRIAKCLLAMLSQRVSDMSQAEELSTKLRTLSYDHERLVDMHRAATENVLCAEREANMYKSRLAAAARSLQLSESSHKQTTAELQRTRTSLQALRATHAAELKKREKEIERMVDKWTKLADSQAKSSTISSGMVISGANAEVVSGMERLGKGSGYLEVALEHAERSRKELLDETTRLRRLILVSANRLQSIIYEIRVLASTKSEEPPCFDHDALFPLTPINAADDKILSLFASANDAISILSKHLSDSSSATQASSSAQSSKAGSEECRRLQAVIEKLQTDLDEAKKLHKAHETETRDLLDQLAAHEMQRASMDDLATLSERDAEHDRLDRIRKELKDEREKFTQAAVKLGKDKSTFESERIKFLEEKRSWQVHQMLSERPSTLTPEVPPPGVPLSPSLAAYLPEVRKSPRKSPRKQKVVGKSGSGRKTRVSRRSSIFSIPPPTHVEPAYETEVIPIVVPAPKPSASDKTAGLTKSILPTSFVLPPPSPRTSLPPPDALLEPLENYLPETDPHPAERSGPPLASPPSPPSPLPIPSIVEPAPMPGPAPAPALALAAPRTPPAFRCPFPVAKPLAPHMTHAYSPIKPSPLSRILMLADSPESSARDPEFSPTSERDGQAAAAAARLGARELTAGARDDDSPLREKRTERNAAVTQKKHKNVQDAKKRTSKSKERSGSLKVREEPASAPTAPTTRSKTVRTGAGEKENREKPPLRRGSPPALGTAPSKPPSMSATSKPDVLPVKSTDKAPAYKMPVGRGGARRVPIGSAEAAPLPSWRG